MGKTWVLPAFKNILVESSDEYRKSTDKGKDKTRTSLIARVAGEIRQAVEESNDSLPEDLEKAVRTWFQNEAGGYTEGKKEKADTHGHATKSWTAKAVCGNIHSDRVADVQKRLSGGAEKNLAHYRPALTEVFDNLSDDERQNCETLAGEWNKSPVPEDVQRRLSKKIPSEVAEWTQYMHRKTGVVFFMVGAYTDEDGGLCVARYETGDLNFMSTQKQYRKGPNNIMNVWTKFIEEKEEMAGDEEKLELDSDDYPRLPDDVLTLRLSRKKAIIRQYVGAARRYFNLTGRIPWSDISDKPSRHLSKRSRPDSDDKLMDPSHMKAKAIDEWLTHWLNLQKKKKCPLMFRDPSKDEPDAKVPSKSRSKGKKDVVDAAASGDSGDEDGGSGGVSRKTISDVRKSVKGKGKPANGSGDSGAGKGTKGKEQEKGKGKGKGKAADASDNSDEEGSDNNGRGTGEVASKTIEQGNERDHHDGVHASGGSETTPPNSDAIVDSSKAIPTDANANAGTSTGPPDSDANVDSSKAIPTDSTANGDASTSLPLAPQTGSRSKASRLSFLKSLSEDKNYRDLIKLLHAAKVGPLTGTPGPKWASWASQDRFLPKAFYQVKGAGSLSNLTSWLQMDPIVGKDDKLASYSRVEVVILAIGLAMRGLWVSQFPESFSDVPEYAIDSPFEFRQYEQLSHNAANLLTGFEDTLAQIDKAFPEAAPAEPTNGQSTSNDAQPSKGRVPGLAGIPHSLQYLREEVGLCGKAWEDLGKPWHTIAALWLRAETVLAKTGRLDNEMRDIHLSSLPQPLKDWIFSKIMRQDATRPGEPFGNVFTDYLANLPWDALTQGDAILDQIWCRPGKTGIIVLLLGLYWQAEHSEGRNAWQENVKRVDMIFQAVLKAPKLQRAKRGRAESSGQVSPTKRTRK